MLLDAPDCLILCWLFVLLFVSIKKKKPKCSDIQSETNGIDAAQTVGPQIASCSYKITL